MGYVGLVPGSVWIWRPANVQIMDSWHTLISEFENGAEQRRAKWIKPRMTVRMRYERGTITPDDVADIWRFYQVQQGAFRTFNLPLFGQLTTVASAYVGGLSLGLSDTQDFTSELSSRWAKLYVQNAAGTFDTFTVTSVVNASHVRIQSASATQSAANSYPLGAPVSPVITARFAQDTFGQEYLVALMTTLGVDFTEVRS